MRKEGTRLAHADGFDGKYSYEAGTGRPLLKGSAGAEGASSSRHEVEWMPFNIIVLSSHERLSEREKDRSAFQGNGVLHACPASTRRGGRDSVLRSVCPAEPEAPLNAEEAWSPSVYTVEYFSDLRKSSDSAR